MSDLLTRDELTAIRQRSAEDYLDYGYQYVSVDAPIDVAVLLAHVDALEAELDVLHRVIDDLPEGAKAFFTTRWRQEAATNREAV